MVFSVQIARGVAAMMVVFAHIQTNLVRFESGDRFAWLGAGVSGVDVFFVISGFIIWCTSQSDRMNPATFLSRRAIRIIPLYWLITSFLVAVALLAPSVLNSTTFDLNHVIASYGFIAYPHPVLKDPFPILVPGWSLNFEALFYVLFGIALFAPGRIATFFVTSAAIVALVLAGMILRPANAVLFFYTDPIMLEFVFGMCIGLLFTHGPKVPLWIALPSVVLGILGIVVAGAADVYNDHHIRFLTVGIPAALVIFGITAAKRHDIDPKLDALVLLGDASYSIYLTHVLVVPAMSRAWSKLALGTGLGQVLLFMACQTVAVIVVGVAVHRLVEKPMIEWLRGLAKARRSTAPVNSPR